MEIVRKDREEEFHDNWARGEEISKIDVRGMNEAATAPEMRCIRQALGHIKGKTLLDVGCGLGEASVYFAMEGAEVIASDLSQGMLDATTELAKHNGVTVTCHKSDAEDLGFPADKQFDIIYVGNLFHHVDIETTLTRLIPHLKPEGVLVSWDPLTYNPLINVYRRMATEVRTEDERPFSLSDIRKFDKFFGTVHKEWFWLTTLAVFISMAVVQRRNPNKERFWKKVVQESKQWEWMYKPLAALDKALLKLFPFLGPLCWNVVLVCRNPRQSSFK